jgi:hypothetical protein
VNQSAFESSLVCPIVITDPVPETINRDVKQKRCLEMLEPATLQRIIINERFIPYAATNVWRASPRLLQDISPTIVPDVGGFTAKTQSVRKEKMPQALIPQTKLEQFKNAVFHPANVNCPALPRGRDITGPERQHVSGRISPALVVEPDNPIDVDRRMNRDRAPPVFQIHLPDLCRSFPCHRLPSDVVD